MSLDILVVTRNRPDQLRELISHISERIDLTRADIKMLILDNGSDEPLFKDFPNELPHGLRIEFLRTEENLGVCGGRNFLLERSQAEFKLEIDDDAEILTPNLPARISEVFSSHPKVGVLAFKILRDKKGQFASKEYPFFNKKRPIDQKGYTAWFIGCAHVFRAECLKNVGKYRDFFPYGSEEQDLSLRVFDAGWDIYYDPACAVIHHPAQAGRAQAAKGYAAFALKQRWKAIGLNLPFVFLPFHLTIRGLIFAVQYRDLTVPFQALRLLWKERHYILATRRSIGLSSIWKLFLLRGPLFF